jgi:hypothetical protein
VRQLLADGWLRAPTAPVWAFLPAVWPRQLRAWVPARGTWYHAGPAALRYLPLSIDDVADLERDAAALCAAAGVPPCPPGRLWLLRPIAGVTPKAVCEQSSQLVGDGAFVASPELTEATRTVISGLVPER